MGYVYMSDLADLGEAEPSPAGKASLSSAAKGLAEQASTASLAILSTYVLPTAQALLTRVLSMPTWNENQTLTCGLPFADPCWSNKNAVRLNLQIAVDTARTRLAQAAGQPRPAGTALTGQAPVQDVNVARATVAATPGAVVEEVQRRADQVTTGASAVIEGVKARLGYGQTEAPAQPVAQPIQPTRPTQPTARSVQSQPRPQPTYTPAPYSPSPPRSAQDIQFNVQTPTFVPVQQAPAINYFSSVGPTLQASTAASAQRMAEATAASDAARLARGGPVQVTAPRIARPTEPGMSQTTILLLAGGGVLVVGGVILLVVMSGRQAPVQYAPPSMPPGYGPPYYPPAANPRRKR